MNTYPWMSKLLENANSCSFWDWEKWKLKKGVQIDFMLWCGCKKMKNSHLLQNTASRLLECSRLQNKKNENFRNCCYSQKHGTRSTSCQSQVLTSAFEDFNRFCRFRFLCAWCTDQIRGFSIVKTSSLKRPFQCGHNHLIDFRFQQHSFSSNKFFLKIRFH